MKETNKFGDGVVTLNLFDSKYFDMIQVPTSVHCFPMKENDMFSQLMLDISIKKKECF